ncbi:acyltransferase family protein [Streptosporangium sp. NPDC087985]|uniref:acyltransferase family protein n=1 Tax=Streptosporangium sp. NPDC087985 TaxID=3366196 RepID=UPI0038168FB2
MSDTRSPFSVPTPWDDGAPGAGTGRAADGQGRTPAPWPMPEHAQPSPASWPDPPDHGPASTRGGLQDGPGPDEGPGEVTVWGYPAYQEPPSAAAEQDAWANWDTQTPPGEQERAPHRDSRPSSERDVRTPYPDARRNPLDMTFAPAPAGNLLDPLDPAWSSGQGTAQAPAGAAPWAPAPSSHRAEPQEAPARTERPFSYWENSSRDPEPSPWSPAPEAEREPRPEEDPAAPPARKKREPYLDNVKFILIVLVVTGHSLVPTLAAHSAKAAYLFIYTFHMPAFVLISGYLGRNFWNSNAKINKLVDTMLVPYVVVEVGYALLRYSLGQKWSLTIIDPAWLNWYLVALVLWRISTPVWTRMRQPLLVAVIIYMVAGFSEISGDFSMDRFFGLLPFYVLGLILKPEHFDLLKPLWVKILAGITLAGGAAVAIFIAPHASLKPIYFRSSFKAMGLDWLPGLGLRGAMLVAALALSVAVLALVPRRETWFSDLGTRTLYAYLLHGVVVLIAKDQKWLSFPWLYGPLGVMAIMSSALALAIVLCLPETRKLFKWLLEPRLVWLYRRPQAASPGNPAETPGKESSAAISR